MAKMREVDEIVVARSVVGPQSGIKAIDLADGLRRFLQKI
jgi:hypothetical protein